MLTCGNDSVGRGMDCTVELIGERYLRIVSYSEAPRGELRCEIGVATSLQTAGEAAEQGLMIM